MTMHDVTDPDRDMPDTIIYNMDGEQKLIIKRYNPHGFWRIHFAKGTVPDDLSGHYTEVRYAKMDVERYLRLKDRDAKIEERLDAGKRQPGRPEASTPVRR